MSGALSKRQQARNERAIQDLIKSVPGNNVCADCQARNPGWASWSLGIFLCMRCAALHRKMGTHISKVKSLSMDSWSNEQVENMKRVGNVASNRIYNPNNTRPPIPFDADEADSAMERFIRKKYQDRVLEGPARNNTGSTNSDDNPPPLPPKTGSRFGFRSASSIFPLSSKAKRQAAATRSDFNDDSRRERSPSPPRNKQSRVFGATVNVGDDDLESKMVKLRDMGFRDEKRNIAVLKGLGGNLEKSIETLVRLGEGNGLSEKVKMGDTSGPSSRSRTPLSATGLSNFPSSPRSPKSSNPFDMLDLPQPVAQPVAQPQSTQSTGTLLQGQTQMMPNNPYQQQAANSNPFGLAPSQSQYNLNQAFQNMSVSPKQPLFPNHTGGFPGPQQQQQIYQQSMTPPVPSLPSQYYPSVIYENPAQQPTQQVQQPQQNVSYNPFMQQPQQLRPQQQTQQVSPINTNVTSNPYMQQLATPQSLYQSPAQQSPMQQQTNPFFNQSAQASPAVQQMNPFFAQSNQQQQMSPQVPQQMGQQMQQQVPQQQMQQQSLQQIQQQMSQQAYNFQSQQAQYQQYGQQGHPTMSQPLGMPDKRSILDLYNYPAAPGPIQQKQEQGQGQNQPLSAMSTSSAANQQPMISSPLAGGSNNPFALSGSGVQSAGADTLGAMGQFVSGPNGARHISQESIAIDTGGWSNGRHSPDAWGSISARSMR